MALERILETKSGFGSFDTAKLIAAFCVVLIHTHPVESLSLGAEGFVRCVFLSWSVPFFFVVSSFLFFRGTQGVIGYQAFFKFAKRLGVLYLVWTILEIPTSTYPALLAVAHGKMSVPHLIRMFFFGALCFGGWYLPALALGSFLVMIGRRYLGVGACLIISVCCYALSVMDTSYHSLLPASVIEGLSLWTKIVTREYTLSFPFGLLFIVMGLLFAENEERLRGLRVGRARIGGIALLGLAICFAAVESGLTLTRRPYMLFTTPFLVAAVCLICFIHPGKVSAASEFRRRASTLVFFSHGIILHVYCSIFSVDSVMRNSFVVSAVVLALSGLFTFGILALRRRGSVLVHYLY